MTKLTPPLTSPTTSQNWMIWHKDIGTYLNRSNAVKSQLIDNVQDKLNYNINGAMMTIQYYGNASTSESTIIIPLPVQCRNRSIVDMYYSDGSSTTLVIEADAKSITIPVNVKDLTDKTVHIQGQVFIVT